MSTRAQILAEISAQFPDNTTGVITPARLRQVTEDIANSCAVPAAGDGALTAASITDASASGRTVITGTPAQARAAIGAAAASSTLFGRIDVGSLLPGNPSFDIWTPFFNSYVSTAAITNDTDSGFLNGVLLNGSGNAQSGGHRTAYFLAPAGATRVTLTVRAKRPNGVASSTLGISIRTSWASGTELGIAQCVLGETEAEYSVTANVTAGTAYLAMVATNYTGYPTGGGSSSQARAVVTSIKLASNATGFWATDFLRVEPDPANIRGGRRTINTSAPAMSFKGSPMANWTIETDATTAVIEYFPEDASNPIGVEWSGGGITINPPSYGGLLHTTVTLPSGLKEVTFYDAMKITDTHSGSFPADNPTLNGALIRCVYLNAGSSVKHIRRGTERRIVCLSDSILSGSGAINPSFLGTLGLLERLMPCEVVQEGADALSLYQIAHNAATAVIYAKRARLHRPSDILVALGVNDYGFATDTAAGFGTDYGTLLDTLHTWNPEARIWALSLIVRATETANSKGSTLGDYRTAIATAVAARSWVTLIDSSAALLSSDLIDGLHPNPGGHDKYSRFIRDSLIS